MTAFNCTTHGLSYGGKRAFCAEDPYGVPTGTVPRVGSAAVRGMTYQLTPEDEVEIKRRQAEMVAAIELTALGPRPDPVQQAVDDYLLMELKAKAWDSLRGLMKPDADRIMLARMDELLRPLA